MYNSVLSSQSPFNCGLLSSSLAGFSLKSYWSGSEGCSLQSLGTTCPKEKIYLGIMWNSHSFVNKGQ